MNRIFETTQVLPAVIPQDNTAGGSVTGPYQSMANKIEDALVNVQFGAVAEGKFVKVELLEADDNSGTNAQELTDAEVTYTAPTGGVTSGQIMVSLNIAKMNKPYLAVKISNDNAAAVKVAAELICKAVYRKFDLNSQAKIVKVV